mmetsp:Transcript_129597/g.415557  ORF Transcript_129597/g.415557 Transcript_129597/m.415557 type:complete len:323 (-) Transcript_129597:126-1094(-)
MSERADRQPAPQRDGSAAVQRRGSASTGTEFRDADGLQQLLRAPLPGLRALHELPAPQQRQAREHRGLQGLLEVLRTCRAQAVRGIQQWDEVRGVDLATRQTDRLEVHRPQQVKQQKTEYRRVGPLQRRCHLVLARGRGQLRDAGVEEAQSISGCCAAQGDAEGPLADAVRVEVLGGCIYIRGGAVAGRRAHALLRWRRGRARRDQHQGPQALERIAAGLALRWAAVRRAPAGQAVAPEARGPRTLDLDDLDTAQERSRAEAQGDLMDEHKSLWQVQLHCHKLHTTAAALTDCDVCAMQLDLIHVVVHGHWATANRPVHRQS